MLMIFLYLLKVGINRIFLTPQSTSKISRIFLETKDAYVRESLTCKRRHDLEINGFEVV